MIDKKQRYLVNNTCAFDFVAFKISKAYLDNPKYQTFDEDNNHQFLNFCNTFVIYGSSKQVYKDRLKTFQTIFEKNCGVSYQIH